MLRLILIFLFQMVLFMPFASDNLFIGYSFVFINSILSLAVLFSIKVKFKILILLGFILRLGLIYFNEITGFLDLISGDSIGFDLVAMNFVNGDFSETKGFYAHFLAFFYNLLGHQKIIGAYINVLVSLCSMIVVSRITEELGLKRRLASTVMFIICFAPFVMMFDSSLLREALIRFGVVLSLYYFLKWWKSGKTMYCLFSLFAIIIGAIFHGAVIIVFSCYLMAFLFYNTKTGATYISIKSLFVALGVVLIAFWGLFGLGLLDSRMLILLERADDMETTKLITSMLYSTGRSAYLTWINPDSMGQIILFSPLKIFYFLFSPMPWDWSAFIDLLGFFLDSIIYIWLIYYIYRHYRATSFSQNFVRYLTIGLIFTFFAFGYGTWNSGTAIRHRAKFIPILVVMYAVVRQEHEKVCELNKLK